MATFINDGDYQFTFINHSDTKAYYELGQATGGDNIDIRGDINPGQTVKSKSFKLDGRTLEQGNVPIISIANAPAPNFRLWSGSDGQYINALATNGYTVKTDTSEISEVTGNGFRVTVDGGGVNDPKVSDIYVQLYKE